MKKIFSIFLYTFIIIICDFYLVCFDEKAIVIARLLSCKNFSVAHYSKSIKGINTKLGIIAHHDNMTRRS